MGVAALLAIVAVGCSGGGGATSGGGGGGNSVAATVNNDPIPMTELANYMMRKSTVQVLPPTQPVQGPFEARVSGSIGLQALRDLVQDRLILQIAKDENVMPTAEDINKEIEFQQKVDPNFIKTLNGAGLTLEDIRQLLTVSLARYKVLTKGITVTDADVDKFIKDNPQQFVTPASSELFAVTVREDAKRAQVDKDLRAGLQFPQVAARYSDDPTARQTNGRLPVTDENALPPPVAAALKKTAVGKTTEWVRLQDGWVKLFVQNRTPEKKINIDDTIKERVRRDLATLRGSQAKDLGKTVQDRMKNATIDVKVPFLRDSWKRAMDQLKAQDAAAGQPGGAPAPAPGG